MIGRLNHVAIVVPDLGAAAAVYRDTLGARVSAAEDLPDHGVTTVFVELPNTKIELLHPLGAGSPIARFLEANPAVKIVRDSLAEYRQCCDLLGIGPAARARLANMGVKGATPAQTLPGIGAKPTPLKVVEP